MKGLLNIDDFMPTERKCVRILRKLRWPKGIKCVYCHCSHPIMFGKYRKYMNRYLCKKCHRSFNDLTGTIFENSKLELRQWFTIAKWLSMNISMNQIHKELGIAYQHVMRVCHKVMKNTFMNKFVDVLEGETPPRKRGLKLRGRGT